MKSLSRSLIVLLVFLSLSPSLQAKRSALIGGGSWVEQIQPLRDSVVVTTPQNQHVQINQALQGAQKSIAMSMYHLTDPQLIETLIAAVGRGVSVQVILDSSSLSNPKYKAIFDQLTAGKVAVTPSSPQFRITHTKSFIVDDRLAFISTMNLVGHFMEMRDYGLFTQDPAIIQEMKSVFTSDLQNAKNKTADSPPLSNPNLVWSPVNSEAKLVDLINFAKTSVAAIVENIGKDTAVAAALIAAKKRGVVVQVLTPECDLNPDPLFNYPALYLMSQAGVENRLAASPSTPQTPYMHAKTIVIDHKIAFLGSENFSYSSLKLSREVGVVFANPNAIKTLEAYIAQDWAAAKPLPTTPTQSCPKMSLLPGLED